MKKIFATCIMMLLVSAAAWAGSYTSSSFNMSFSYPEGWSLNEMKMPTAGDAAKRTAAQSATNRFGGVTISDPTGFRSGGDIAGQAIDAAVGTAQDTAVAGVGGAIMEQQIKKMMPKFMSVTLKNSSGAQIMVTGVEGMAAPAGTAGGGGGGGSGKTECVTSSEPKRWGGKSVTLMTTRCPQGDEWQFSSVASMKKGNADFFIMGMMSSKSNDMAEFNSVMKGAIDQVMSSTSFQ